MAKYSLGEERRDKLWAGVGNPGYDDAAVDNIIQKQLYKLTVLLRSEVKRVLDLLDTVEKF